jgi:hypothetical protein
MPKGSDNGFVESVEILTAGFPTRIDDLQQTQDIVGVEPADWSRAVGRADYFTRIAQEEFRGLDHRTLVIPPRADTFSIFRYLEPISERKLELRFLDNFARLFERVQDNAMTEMSRALNSASFA